MSCWCHHCCEKQSVAENRKRHAGEVGQDFRVLEGRRTAHLYISVVEPVVTLLLRIVGCDVTNFALLLFGPPLMESCGDWLRSSLAADISLSFVRHIVLQHIARSMQRGASALSMSHFTLSGRDRDSVLQQ